MLVYVVERDERERASGEEMMKSRGSGGSLKLRLEMEDVVRNLGHVVGPSLREAASKSAVPAMSGAYLIGAWSFLMRKTS